MAIEGAEVELTFDGDATVFCLKKFSWLSLTFFSLLRAFWAACRNMSYFALLSAMMLIFC